MMMPVIPASQHALISGNLIDKRWHEFFRQLAAASATNEQVSAIATALGSPDGTVSSIPPVTTQEPTRIFSTEQISALGNPTDGYLLDLRLKADTGTGALHGITRDDYGRITGTTDATITGTAGQIDVANGDAVSGPPTLSLADVADSGAGTLQKTDFDAKGRKTGTAAATTDDLTEGTTNLYFTEERAQDAVGAAIAAGTGDGVTLAYDDAGNAVNAVNTDKGSVALQQNTTASYVDGYGFTKTLSIARQSDYDDGGIRKVNGGLTARTRFSPSDEYDTEISGTGVLAYSYDPSQSGTYFNTSGAGFLGDEISFSKFTISKTTKVFTGSRYLTLVATGMPAAVDGLFTSETISVPYATGTLALEEEIQKPVPIVVPAGTTYTILENTQMLWTAPIELEAGASIEALGEFIEVT